jgi:hypothetical protein
VARVRPALGTARRATAHLQGRVRRDRRVVPANRRTIDLDPARSAVEKAVPLPPRADRRRWRRDERASDTTAGRRGDGDHRVVGSYTTTYGGTPGRLHNVQLVAELIDGALVAPGARFSFNQTTGERNAAKGFEEAPVIINGELESGIGGGVCQVSTTVFNAAFEAGLSIEKRTNHALYISHYPIGRDATVNYPDFDLVFRNDTDHWLLLRTFVGPARSPSTSTAPRRSPRRDRDGTARGRREGAVEADRRRHDVQGPEGRRAMRLAAALDERDEARLHPDGDLLYNTTWRSYYVGEPTVVRLGTKPRPKPKPSKPAESRRQAATTPTTTEPALPHGDVDAPRP